MKVKVQAGSLGELGYQIEALVQAIKLTPADVEMHKKLRWVSLQYKAAGGKAAGMFERMKWARDGAVDRLAHSERLLAMDPGNIDCMLQMLRALHEMEQEGEHGDVEAVVRWVSGMIKRANGE